MAFPVIKEESILQIFLMAKLRASRHFSDFNMYVNLPGIPLHSDPMGAAWAQGSAFPISTQEYVKAAAPEDILP